MDFVYTRTYTGPLKGVIFDWAGTLADYGCFAPAAVFMDVFRKYGVEITMQQAREPMGMGKRDHIATIAAMTQVAKQWEAHHGKPCSEDDIDSLYADFIPMQLDCIANYATLIPGAIEAAELCRERGMKIGTSTGYNGDMLDICVAEAKKQGFEADSNVSNSDVPVGRPAPWMCFENAKQLGIYPMEAMVKVGDTVPDIGEGLNAGMWTVGTSLSGNEMGMSLADANALSAAEMDKRRKTIEAKLSSAGAHYVIDSVVDLAGVLDDINRRLDRGERP